MNKPWFDHKCEKKRDNIETSFEGKSSDPLDRQSSNLSDRQLKETFNHKLKEYKIVCNSKSPCFGTLE